MLTSAPSFRRVASCLALILTGPIAHAVQPVVSPGLIISEFRLRGPSGATDEFIELYNSTNAPITVSSVDGSSGWGVAASDGVLRFLVPNGTTIPAHGHYLGVNSLSYSLASYAVGDATYTNDIPDNAGIALFSSSTSFTLANRLDAVGSHFESNSLYKEGTGYSALTPFSIDCSLYRNYTSGAPSPNDDTISYEDGEPIDTNNNATDFVFVDTNGTSAGAGQLLGAPGPQNLASPIATHRQPLTLGHGLADPAVALNTAPNLHRTTDSNPSANSTYGQLEFTRTFTNNTGAPLTRLRFRFVKLSTFPASSGTADLRPITSLDGPTSTMAGPIPVSGTVLEQGPPQPNGGGWNSTFGVNGITLGSPLAPGATVSVRFRFGIQQTGAYRFGLLAEANPGVSHFWIVSGATGEAPFSIATAIERGPFAPDIAVVHPGTENDLPSGGNLDFGDIQVEQSLSKIVTIKNTGNATLNIANITMIGYDAESFTLNTSGTSLSLAPGAHTALALSFAPTHLGAHHATLRITSDDGDETEFNVSLTGSSFPIPPFVTPLASRGQDLSEAGVDTRIQAGAKWYGFGTPALNRHGQVAFLGKWKAPSATTPVKIPAQSGTGIFINEQLLVKVGDPVPGIPNTVFKSFKDPVINDDGQVAFIAGIRGATTATVVPATADTVVVTNGRDGNLEVLAREGGPAPETANATFKSFGSVAITSDSGAPEEGPELLSLEPGSNSTVLFTAALSLGGTVTAANDVGAWWLPAHGSSVVSMVQEGQSDAFHPPLPIKSFVLLKALAGSPAVNRGLVNTQTAYLVAGSTIASRQALFVRNQADFIALATTNTPVGGGSRFSSNVWGKFSLPSADRTGQTLFFAGAVKPGPEPAGKGLWFSTNGGQTINPYLLLGETLVEVNDGTPRTLNTVKDPILSPDGQAVAWLGALTPGHGVNASNNDGLWTQYGSGGPITIVARENAQPPGAPAGAQWKSFSSVAMPGDGIGPIFTATMRIGTAGQPGPGGITSKEDLGFYGRDGYGALHEILREGQPLLGKQVKAFNVLKAAAGTVGSARAFNSKKQIVLLVTFDDNTTAIVGVQLATPAPMISL